MESLTRLGLREELANQALLFLVFDSREHLGAEAGDSFGFVEWHLVVDFATGEMARHAA